MHYSLTQVADYRKCSRQYIHELIVKGRLKAEKVGNQYIINEKECIKLWGDYWKIGK